MHSESIAEPLFRGPYVLLGPCDIPGSCKSSFFISQAEFFFFFLPSKESPDQSSRLGSSWFMCRGKYVFTWLTQMVGEIIVWGNSIDSFGRAEDFKYGRLYRRRVYTLFGSHVDYLVMFQSLWKHLGCNSCLFCLALSSLLFIFFRVICDHSVSVSAFICLSDVAWGFWNGLLEGSVENPIIRSLTSIMAPICPKGSIVGGVIGGCEREERVFIRVLLGYPCHCGEESLTPQRGHPHKHTRMLTHRAAGLPLLWRKRVLLVSEVWWRVMKQCYKEMRRRPHTVILC